MKISESDLKLARAIVQASERLGMINRPAGAAEYFAEIIGEHLKDDRAKAQRAKNALEAWLTSAGEEIRPGLRIPEPIEGRRAKVLELMTSVRDLSTEETKNEADQAPKADHRRG